MDIWLQSYEEFVNDKNIIKQRNLNTVFANISKAIWPTSNSFLLIMSHMSLTTHLVRTWGDTILLHLYKKSCSFVYSHAICLLHTWKVTMDRICWICGRGTNNKVLSRGNYVKILRIGWKPVMNNIIPVPMHTINNITNTGWFKKLLTQKC